MKQIKMYASGWAIGNPSTKTGAGVVLVYGDSVKEISKFIGEGTANSCFLSAIILGLQSLKEPCKVDIFCHNKIIVDGANNRNEPRSNLELWIDYREQLLIHDATIQWIKKGSHPHNTLSTELAKRGARY